MNFTAIKSQPNIRLAAHYLRLIRGVNLFYLLRRPWPIWYGLLNREGAEFWKRNPAELSAAQNRVLRDLSRDGIAVTHLAELFPGEDLLSPFLRAVEEYKSAAAVKTKKRFLQYLFDPAPELRPDNPFVRLALDPKILNIANGYMRMWTKFHSFTLNIATPVASGSPPLQSQRWHRDPDDKKMCKLFLYLNDVAEESGPFIYVKGSHYGGKRRRYFPQFPPAGNYPPEGAVERVIPSEFMHKAVGRAGTVIFCDTSGIHRGGYAVSGSRIMFTAVYVSSACTSPATWGKGPGFSEILDGLSKIQKYALETNFYGQ